MTMLSLRRPPAKLHPYAAARRDPRPFGEGVLPPERPTLTIKGLPYDVEHHRGGDGERVVRLSSHADPAGVYDVSRGADGLVRCDCPDYVWKREGTATMCKHGAACVGAGLVEAPAPVPNSADGIPARVRRIRVVDGPSAGVWIRPAAGARWAFEGDDTGRWLAATVADDWYRAGRVAILADAPAPRAKPAPTPSAGAGKAVSRRGPSAEDLAFEAGRSIALESEAPVEAPRRYTPAERDAFLAGLMEGAAIAHADELARLDALELQASYDHSEMAEARMALPACSAVD